jgi:hypothetical protein
MTDYIFMHVQGICLEYCKKLCDPVLSAFFTDVNAFVIFSGIDSIGETSTVIPTIRYLAVSGQQNYGHDNEGCRMQERGIVYMRIFARALSKISFLIFG